jgi:Glycosyl hydrolase family 10
MKFSVWAFVWLLLSVSGVQADVPLVTLQPQSVLSRDPRRDTNPQPSATLKFRDRVSRSVIRFSANSEVSYIVPVGQKSFSGVIAYAEVNGANIKGEEDAANRLRVSILVEGKVVFDTTMDGLTPPQEFVLTVANARQITIVSTQDYSWEDFALVDASFSNQRPGINPGFVLSKGEGFVNIMPLTRQGLFHVYRPGESVSLKVYFGGAAESSKVSIRVTPEQPAPAIPESTIHLVLRSTRPVSDGAATWTVPNWRGPAMLEVEERVNGQSVFHRQLRIAIAPEVKLAKISDSTFGLHTSSAGFLRPTEEYASLWGAKWNRVLLRWEIVESKEGNYDFSRADEIVDSLLAQDMRILGVLGESAPEWAGLPGSRFHAAWKNFVDAAVRHYRGKINHWDIFNEVDVKYEHLAAQGDPEFDLRLLRTGIDAVHSANSQAKAICCSTGSTPWLLYDKRLFDAGILRSLDSLSFHPYEQSAPEEKDGAFNYQERLAALESLARSYGSQKPIWATEANWILGTRGEAYVNASDIDEHTQAQYIVRVNLLSLAHSVPYFLHMPFYHSHRKQIHVDALAAYANMASLLSGATNVRQLSAKPELYVFTWDTPNGSVTAAWTVYGAATVTLSGLRNARVLDFYGNQIASETSSLIISGAATFIVAPSSLAAAVTVLKAPPTPVWRGVAPVEHWSRTKESTITNVRGGIEVITPPVKYTYQVRSPETPIRPNTCYLARVKINLRSGSVMVFALDKATEKRVGDPVYVAHVPNGIADEVEWRFVNGTASSVQLLLAGGNLKPTVSHFDVLNPAQIALCP